MKEIISAALASLVLSTGVVLAEDSKLDELTKPLELTETQLDQITAAGLLLPNGREVFADFENPAPFFLHPALNKFLFGPNGQPATEGPWQAHYRTEVIECVGCP